MTGENIVLKAEDLDGYLTQTDNQNIDLLKEMYNETMPYFNPLNEGKVIEQFDKMGKELQRICKENPSLKVFPFETASKGNQAEASRIISKLRDLNTDHQEFVYYSQRAYEMLFKLAFTEPQEEKKGHIVVKTPITDPCQNFAVHKIPNIDSAIENSVMCVMLRGALLPSIIMSKEIEEYSSKKYVTPFALFKINRDDSKHEDDMEYILNLKKSFFDLKELDGKDWIFADPMNATGGSLVTVVKYLKNQGIKPKSIKFFNVISSLKGSLRVLRALPDCTCYTLWLDPVINHKAYILPGLGDAGDRLNGCDKKESPRNIIRLIADYGSQIASLYHNQLMKIEETVLG